MREWWRRQVGPNLPLWVACWVWVTMTAGVIGRVVASPPLKQSVVPIYLTAGQAWRNGSPLYFTPTGLDLYRNPPGVAALFAPLTLLPEKPAAILWRLVCLGVYANGLRGFVRHVLPPVSLWRRSAFWAVSGVLVLPAFNNGQINLLIVGTALCGMTEAARGRWWAAAAWLAGCGWLKIYPLSVGLLGCVVAPRTLSWRLIVMTVYLFVLPFLAQDPTYVLGEHGVFAAEMRVDDRSDAEIVRAPRDWTILPRLWLNFHVPRPVTMSVALAAAAAFAGLVWKDRGDHRWVLPSILGLIWMCLFGPATEMNTYSIAAPVAGAMVATGKWLPRWACGSAWLGTGLMTAAIVRAALPTDGPLPLNGVQVWGSGLLVTAAVGWWLKRDVGSAANGRRAGVLSGTGGI